MKTLTLQDGYVTTCDDSFKEGDLITTYYSGFYEFIRYEDRGNMHAPLVCFKQVFTKNGVPRKSKENCCDAVYCRLTSQFIERKLEQLEQEKTRLLEILTQCRKIKD